MTGEDPAATLEISPLYATTAKQLAQRKPPLRHIEAGDVIYLGEAGIEKG
jgi:hypothetical protein